MNIEDRKNAFLEKARKIHGEKYDYSKVEYINSRENVIITCPIHGDFEQKPYHHLEGYGCHKCTIEETKGYDFEERARLIHNNKYDYSKFVYVNNKTSGTIVCPIHGEFKMSMGAHINAKQGCPKCASEKRNEKNSLGKDEFIEKSIAIFGENAFDYTKVVYKNNKSPLTLICKKCGHEFETRGDNHLSGHGCPNCVKNVSKWENEINEFIKSLGVETETSNRAILNGREIDIFIPSKMIGIECDGLRWHNELYVDKKYHQEKTINAEKNGITLMHFFEDEWKYKKDIVKSIIRNRVGVDVRPIYARKCELVQIDWKTTASFLDENHIQGKVRSKINYGLYFGKELVAVMTFGSLRKNLGNSKKDGHYELLRYANKLNTIVVGGASKILKHFLSEYKPLLIKSYCDKRLFKGNLYNTLGFSYVHTSQPNYFYVVNDKRENRFKYRKDALVSEGFAKDKSEHEIMLERKMYRIYDCGCDLYEYKNEQK